MTCKNVTFLGLFAVLVVSISGCDRERGPTEPASTPATVNTISGPAAAPRTSDEWFARIAREEIPGFGGFFFDEAGMLTFYLKDLTGREHAVAALARILAGQEFALGGRSLDVLAAKALQGEYNFPELAAWRDQIDAVAFPGMVSTDVRESANRVVVGVEDQAARSRLEMELDRLSIPRAAVVIEQQPRRTFRKTLSSYERPVPGGYRVQYKNLSTGKYWSCTAGFVARLSPSGGDYLVTAAHCSTQWGVEHNDMFYQPAYSTVYDRRIAVEVRDPAFQAYLSSSTIGRSCPTSYKCRYSDALLAEQYPPYAGIGSSRHLRFGVIARTTGRDSLSGSVTIDDSQPTFTISGERPFSVTGEVLNKMGIVTGWTYGPVTLTCRNDYHGIEVFLCEDVFDTGVDFGDSGGPVFRWDGGSTVVLYGVVSSGDPGSVYFSPMSNIEVDLGGTAEELYTHY